MKKIVVGFIPPILGVEGKFNTFRIGGFYNKNLKEGDEVFLLNEKEKAVFGIARVESVEIGRLDEMCILHGDMNHGELANISNDAPQKLFKTIQKIYGPHIAPPQKLTTVLYLQRINDGEKSSA